LQETGFYISQEVLCFGFDIQTTSFNEMSTAKMMAISKEKGVNNEINTYYS